MEAVVVGAGLETSRLVRERRIRIEQVQYPAADRQLLDSRIDNRQVPQLVVADGIVVVRSRNPGVAVLVPAREPVRERGVEEAPLPAKRDDVLEPDDRARCSAVIGELRLVPADRVEPTPTGFLLELVLVDIRATPIYREAPIGRRPRIPAQVPVDATGHRVTQILVGVQDVRQGIAARDVAPGDRRNARWISLTAANEQRRILGRIGEDRWIADGADVVRDLVLPVVEAERDLGSRLDDEADRPRLGFFRRQVGVASLQLLELDVAVPGRDTASGAVHDSPWAQHRIVVARASERALVGQVKLRERRRGKTRVVRAAEKHAIHRRVLERHLGVGSTPEVAVVVIPHRCADLQVLENRKLNSSATRSCRDLLRARAPYPPGPNSWSGTRARFGLEDHFLLAELRAQRDADRAARELLELPAGDGAETLQLPVRPAGTMPVIVLACRYACPAAVCGPNGFRKGAPARPPMPLRSAVIAP